MAQAPGAGASALVVFIHSVAAILPEPALAGNRICCWEGGVRWPFRIVYLGMFKVHQTLLDFYMFFLSRIFLKFYVKSIFYSLFLFK